MASKLVVIFSVFVIAVTVAEVSAQCNHSCLDHYKNGAKRNGYYKIHIKYEKTLTVYCDMNSEPGSAWTLVESFAFKNKGMVEFTKRPFFKNAPVNENSPNRALYRMTHAQMLVIKSQSTHWRATCNFPTYPGSVDYTDYVRAKFSSFDLMTYDGHGHCKLVEFVNIRGHQCAHCTSKWWQFSLSSPRIDSSATPCQFKPKQGSVRTEDNFGLYWTTNKKFRCTSGPRSTTNFWFGGYQ